MYIKYTNEKSENSQKGEKEMKKILLYMFCVLAFISIIACPKTSTEMAEIRISLVKSPLVVDPSPEGWVPLPDEPVVILTELNGVGCDISSVKLELVFEGESGLEFPR